MTSSTDVGVDPFTGGFGGMARGIAFEDAVGPACIKLTKAMSTLKTTIGLPASAAGMWKLRDVHSVSTP